MSKSNITIDVEFLVGTGIEDAIKEAKSRAFFWGVAYVRFSFNQRYLSIGGDADVEDTVYQYHNSKLKHIVSA